MQTITQLFNKAWQEAKDKGYDHVVIAVDLHGTIVDSKVFNTTPGSFEDKVNSSIFRSALVALQKLSAHTSVSMFIYSGTKKLHLYRLIDMLNEKYEININLNYGSDTQHASQSFKRKPYYGILIDDKAGFDPDTDWWEINDLIQNLPIL